MFDYVEIAKRGRGSKSKAESTDKTSTIEESLLEPDLDTSKLASETAESEVSFKVLFVELCYGRNKQTYQVRIVVWQ